MNKSTNVKNLTLYGLFIALVYVATRFINVPGPTAGGLFHLGNVMAFTIAIVFGKRAGAISAAFGMALFDLTSSYFIWAPFTFVIRFAMGYIMGHLAANSHSSKKKFISLNLTGVIISTIIMIGGYYIAEAIFTSSFVIPLESIWGNFMQCVFGAVIGLPVSYYLKSALEKRSISLGN